ncbi:cardiac-enriched FHL2-interacting protein [Tupaia chinensis]|uniref:cardiac-enriched FHL2-interacting protein n=1 Tax=Tupaia chinensis TaxID=246437 RepID=UPI0003C90D67|nr:cardiac-enriched FHL2-interacting protein [Tupaia chinensis]
MQGNKKCTDGLSDSSSIGSVLDDADREVSSLTDRAFRSLCISEDTSFHDSDLARSPDITRQVFGTFQGTVSHAHRKSGIWSQLPSQSTEHAGWASTFQQLPKYVQGEEKYPKSSPPPTPAQQRLEVPVSGLRSSNKPISKVSSLIKSFDRTESHHCDSRPPTSKPPALKNPPKFAPLPESGVNFCFDSAFLTVRRVPAEVSSTHQSSHQPGRKHGEQGSPKNPEMTCHGSSSFLPTPDNTASSKFPSPPHKPAKGEPGRGKDWVHKGTFLHSENSAFESWDAHQPKLLERKDTAETVPESKAPQHHEDMPLLREPHPPECKVSPFQARASCSQEEGRLAAGPWGSQDPGPQVFPVEGKLSSSQPEPQMKSTQPPWRKPKTGKGGKENLQDALEEKKRTDRRGPPLYTKHNPQGQLPENEALDMPLDPKEHYEPPFNISKLLTPIIPTKHAPDSADSQPEELALSPPGQLNGYQEKEPSECQARDSYKSKAPSLLFNLKDVRKRVKSTYSPLPLLKGPDERARGKVDGKQEPLSNGVFLPNGLEESPPNELSQERPAEAPTARHIGTQDPTASPSASPAHPTLRSPPAVTKAPFCVNGEVAEKGSHEMDHDADGESEMGPSRSSWGPDSRERRPRKHLSLKLCNRETEAGKAEERSKTQYLERGLPRSISQETEPEREVGLQSSHVNQKVSPGPLSPEEEDVFYSDTQSDFMPGLKSKAKFSTSSSDQSFASFEDQHKTWFAESQREDRKKEVSASDSGKDEEEHDESQLCVLSNGHASLEEHGTGASPREAGSLSGGGSVEASTEEAHFSGSWTGGNKDTASSHAKALTPSPSSATNRHMLFAIKDNTLRATPVIRPVMLPLLRAMSSEDALGAGRKEEESRRPGWGEDAGLCAPGSQEVPSTPTPANVQGSHLMCEADEGPGDPGQVFNSARAEASQSADPRKLGPWQLPTITLPEGDIEDQPPPQPLGACWEEQTQGFKSHFLSTPKAGPSGKRLVPGETVTSPNPSSLGEGSACSPAASSFWDEACQAPSELGLLPEEPPRAGPWASPGSAPVTRREDLTHAVLWEAGSDPQAKSWAEDLRALSPRASAGHPAQMERAAGKPPAVPPKTEKALRRAKKLASKRRKTDQAQERREGWEGPPGDPERHPAQHPAGQRPGEEHAAATGLDIISTDDLEDFATEGIS